MRYLKHEEDDRLQGLESLFLQKWRLVEVDARFGNSSLSVFILIFFDD